MRGRRFSPRGSGWEGSTLAHRGLCLSLPERLPIRTPALKDSVQHVSLIT